MAGIRISDRTYIEELAGNQPRNLMVVCERLFLDFHYDSTPREMAVQIAKKLQGNPTILGEMLREEAVDFLFELWQMKESQIVPEQHLEELQQLHYLGFVSADDQDLMVNMEAKDIFFFSLKSHKMRKIMGKYTEWEKIVFGMLFTYGILDVYECYKIFAEIQDTPVYYADFEQFLMLRMAFWHSGLMLRNERTKKLFMASREAEDRNAVFEQWNQHKDLDFCRYSKEEYMNLAMGNGIAGWEGIPELFLFVLESIDQDRYQAMIIIKSIILIIQNGETYLEAILKMNKILNVNSEKDEKEICCYIKKIFYSIPIYGLKGHTREELDQKEMFQVIDGGKN